MVSTDTSTASTENPISMQNPSTSGNESSSTIKTPSSTIPEVITTPAVSLSASTTTGNQAVTASPANATNNPVTNDHGIRDVPSDKETCSTSFKVNDVCRFYKQITNLSIRNIRLCWKKKRKIGFWKKLFCLCRVKILPSLSSSFGITENRVYLSRSKYSRLQQTIADHHATRHHL